MADRPARRGGEADRPSQKVAAALQQASRRPATESKTVAAQVGELVVTSQLRKVSPNPAFQRNLLKQADEAIAGAEKVAPTSPRFALTGAYDAVRHCVDAWLNYNGLRAESGDGAHRTRVKYAELTMTALLSAEDVRDYGIARQLRHDNEYPEPNRPTATAADAERLVQLAKRFYSAVYGAIKQSS